MNNHRSERILARLAVLSVFTLAVGCAPEEKTTSEEVSQTTQALGESEVSPAFTMSIPLPPGTNVQTVTVAGLKAVRLADRVQVPKAVVSTGSASSGGLVEAGVDSKIGPITSYGNVTLRDRASITGNVVAGGTVQKNSTVKVSGTVTQKAKLGSVVNLSWNVSVPGPNLGPVSLEPDTSKNIVPGRYGIGSVKSRSKLTLHTGTYYFDSLTVEPQGKLFIDDAKGPVQIYIGNSLTYRGEIHPATVGVPKLLFGVRGTGGVMIEAPFTGVVIAPQSDIRIQAARPEGHRAAFFGKNVNLEPDTIMRAYPFEWAPVVGGKVNPDIPDTNPHQVIISKTDTTLTVGVEGTGTTTTTTNTGTVVDFTLPADYTVDGGLIANGSVQFTCTTPAGTSLTCSYQGQSSTGIPITRDDLIKGRALKFVSCSDGQPASTLRHCTNFTTTLTPAPGLPVTVSSPVQEVDACHEKVEIISALQTYEMRKNFTWNGKQPVEATNAGGEHALYYAWVYVRDQEDLLNLRKLWIHQLTRPLFTEELEAMSGKCGAFINPGDGEGFLVPVVIPGKTYNKLLEVMESGDVTGDKVLFDAVIIRDVPVGARNPNGSIKLDVLKNAHFVYLPYETRPLPASDSLVLESGASKVLVGAVSWVAVAVKDVGEFFTNTLAYIDKWARGTTTVNLQISAITGDPAFTSSTPLLGSQYPAMIRGWGDAGGQKLGAPGLQVSVLQKFLGSFVPETSQGHTGTNGNVSIDAVDGGSIRGATGLCIELANDAAKIVGDNVFFLPEEICDFRAFDANDTPPMGGNVPAGFKLEIKADPQAIHIQNTLLAGHYQADDVYRYAQRVVGFSAKQARIITGYWADTMSKKEGTAYERLFVPCLNYTNMLSDAAVAAGMAAGALGGYVAGPVGSVLGSIGGAYISLHMGNADIVMSANSILPLKRAVMSHEMGHYMFCSMVQEENADAINWLLLSTISDGGEDAAIRYLNESVADFFTGQVAGASDYAWGDQAGFYHYPGLANPTYFCAPQTGDGNPDTESRCWESNLYGVGTAYSFDPRSIGRVATMIHDAVDNPNAARGTVRAEMGNAWKWTNNPLPGGTNKDYPLQYSEKDYLLPDFENVSIGDTGIRTFAHKVASGFSLGSSLSNAVALLDGVDISDLTELASRLGQIHLALTVGTSDSNIYRALSDTMVAHGGHSWCERCAVLATHMPGLTPPTDWTPELFQACKDDSFLAAALNQAPPDPNLNLNRTSCTACPAGTARNADYTACVVCNGVVVGDKCEPCGPDVVIDGATVATDSVFTFPSNHPQDPGDACPNVLWVQVSNVPAMFSLHPTMGSLVAELSWTTAPGQEQADCARLHTMYFANQTGTIPFFYSVQQAAGTYNSSPFYFPIYCYGMPSSETAFSNVPYTNVRFGIPTGGPDRLIIRAPAKPGNPV